MDLNKLPAVNGAHENIPADGAITAHIQVMIIQSIDTFFFILKVILLYWFNGLGVKGLLHNLSLLHISSGAYLNHPFISSLLNSSHCSFI